MSFALFGLSYKTAPLDLREAVSFDQRGLLSALPSLTCEPALREAVVLSTCHRTEIYVELTDVAAAKEQAMAWLASQRGLHRRAFTQHVYHHFDADAVRHLFSVAAGLDSLVLGEDQVLGQVRQAYKVAIKAGTVRTRLDTAFRRALRAGKRVRTETGLNRSATSIASVAADLARDNLGSLAGRRVLVIGAGEMAELATQHLVQSGASELIVANRSPRRRDRLAKLHPVQAKPLHELPALVLWADIIIASTSAGRHLVTAAMLADRARPLVIIDLGLPRDVEPAVAALPRVTLYNIDQLDQAVAGRQQAQGEDYDRAWAIVDQELQSWNRWYASLGVTPTVAALAQQAEQVRDAELNKTLARLGHLTDRDKNEVAALAQAITAKLIHRPLARLKAERLPDGYADLVRDLFGLPEPPADE